MSLYWVCLRWSQPTTFSHLLFINEFSKVTFLSFYKLMMDGFIFFPHEDLNRFHSSFISEHNFDCILFSMVQEMQLPAI